MEELVQTLFLGLTNKAVPEFEMKAYGLANQHDGNVIKHHNIRCTFHTWNIKTAFVPPCKQLFEVHAKFQELKFERDAIYLFISGIKQILRPYQNIPGYPEGFIYQYMLPDELRTVLQVRYEIIDDLEPYREKFREEYFTFDMKRILIKYKLFKQ